MCDFDNRPGGPNLIVTAKMAHKVHVLDAAMLNASGTPDMPGSAHEIALPVDGHMAYATTFGAENFEKNINPGDRVAVVDLASKTLYSKIDIDDMIAPPGNVFRYVVSSDGRGKH